MPELLYAYSTLYLLQWNNVFITWDSGQFNRNEIRHMIYIALTNHKSMGSLPHAVYFQSSLQFKYYDYYDYCNLNAMSDGSWKHRKSWLLNFRKIYRVQIWYLFPDNAHTIDQSDVEPQCCINLLSQEIFMFCILLHIHIIIRGGEMFY